MSTSAAVALTGDYNTPSMQSWNYPLGSNVSVTVTFTNFPGDSGQIYVLTIYLPDGEIIQTTQTSYSSGVAVFNIVASVLLLDANLGPGPFVYDVRRADAVNVQIVYGQTTMTGAASLPSPSLLTNILAYWTLNESSGNRADSVNGFTLAPTGSPGGASGFGNVGNVTTLNGSSQYLSDTSPVITADGWTVAGWVNVSSFSQVAPTLFCQAAGTTGKQVISTTSAANKILVEVNSSGTPTLGSNTVLSTSTWYHIAVTFAAGTMSLYINGALDNSVSGATSDYSGLTQTLLGFAGTGSTHLSGSMVGLGVWGRVVSATGVKNLYNAGNGVAFSSLGNLAG